MRITLTPEELKKILSRWIEGSTFSHQWTHTECTAAVWRDGELVATFEPPTAKVVSADKKGAEADGAKK